MRFLTFCAVIVMVVFCVWRTWDASTQPVEQEQPTEIESLKAFFGIE